MAEVPSQSAADAAAAALKRGMAEKGLSQADLERVSGVTVQTIRRLQGSAVRSYRPDRLAKISLALGWPATALADMLDGVAPASVLATDPDDEIRARLAALETLVHQTLERLEADDARADPRPPPPAGR